MATRRATREMAVPDARLAGWGCGGERMGDLGDRALACGIGAVLCIGIWRVGATVGRMRRGYEGPVTSGVFARRELIGRGDCV
jgi:hypothetical protein